MLPCEGSIAAPAPPGRRTPTPTSCPLLRSAGLLLALLLTAGCAAGAIRRPDRRSPSPAARWAPKVKCCGGSSRGSWPPTRRSASSSGPRPTPPTSGTSSTSSGSMPQASEPDILQLDVIWTPEFAAAGWILDLDRFRPPLDSFFPATIAANRWQGRLYAMPVVRGRGHALLAHRSHADAPPATFDELERDAVRARRERACRYGLVWQGARYEGLVTVFSEYLGSVRRAHPRRRARSRWTRRRPSRRSRPCATRSTSDAHRAAERARHGTKRSRGSRFRTARRAFMRNWPYAYPLMQDSAHSRVAGRYRVAP